MLSIAIWTVSQTPWLEEIGGSLNERIVDIEVDDADQLYVLGEFYGSMQVQGTTLTSAGLSDLFLLKYDASGSLLWAVSAGGTGADIPYAITADVSHVAVTGTYRGNADVFGISLGTANASAEGFVSMIDNSNGSAIWSEGLIGIDGAEKLHDVIIQANGMVTAVGEFVGTINVSGAMATSMTHPVTGIPSIDPIIVRFDASGGLDLLKTGMAKFNDKAMRVVEHSSGALFVAGQYSDTIAFGQNYPSTYTNGIFVLKMDSQGNDLAYTSIGGAAVNTLSGMELSTEPSIILGGDLQGVMIVNDGTAHVVGGGFTYGSYLLKLDLDCDFMDQHVIGASSPISTSDILVRGDSIYCMGTFECLFSSLADHYNSNGLFISTGPQDLWAGKFQLSDLSLSSAQQFGGGGNKYEAVLDQFQNGELVIGGTYTDVIIFPSDCGNWGEFNDPANSLCFAGVQHAAPTICGDPNYGCFAGNMSNGGKDVFVGTTWLKDRSPYDFWNRQDPTSCVFDQVLPCIFVENSPFNVCVDSLRQCGEAVLKIIDDYYPNYSGANLSISYRPDGTTTNMCSVTDQYGPPVSISWNTGSSDNSVVATTSGWYSCSYAMNGCIFGEDSVYVTIDPIPPDPLLFTSSQYWPATGEVCSDSLWLWHQPPPLGITYFWTLPDGTQLTQDSLLVVNVDGAYQLTYSNSSGCESSINIPVSFVSTVALPNLTGVDYTLFTDFLGSDTLSSSDTLYACSGVPFSIGVDYQWQISGVDSLLPTNVFVDLFDGCLWHTMVTAPNAIQTVCLAPTSAGYYSFTVLGQAYGQSCPVDTFYFSITDSVYINVPQQPFLLFSGPNVMCPGDTTAVQLFCFPCDSTSVTSMPAGSFLSASNDTVFLTQSGTVTVDAFTISGGSTCSGTFTYSVSPSLVPVIYANTFAGAMCANDSALMWTPDQGLNYDWIGPSGSLGVNADSVYVSDFGDYYLIHTDMNGCVQTVGPETIFPYSPPTLVAFPSSILCGEDTVIAYVSSPILGAVQWHPPLSGSSFVQFLSDPGVYSCTAYYCGDSVDLSITLLSSASPAILQTSGPYGLCAGDSVVLSVLSSGIAYDWFPSGGNGPSAVISNSGNYQVVVTDPAGCVDTSAVVVVTVDSIPVPLISDSVEACANDVLWLLANSSSLINWYSLPDSNFLIAVGDSFPLAPANHDTVIFIAQTIGQCFDGFHSVSIHFIPDPLSLADDTVLCEGNVLQLSIPTDLVGVIWNTGSDQASITVNQAGLYVVTVTDSIGCVWTDSVLISDGECFPELPNIITPNGDGVNDGFQFTLSGYSKVKMSIFNRWGEQVYWQEAKEVRWNGRNGYTGIELSTGVYYYILIADDPLQGLFERSGYIHLNR